MSHKLEKGWKLSSQQIEQENTDLINGFCREIQSQLKLSVIDLFHTIPDLVTWFILLFYFESFLFKSCSEYMNITDYDHTVTLVSLKSLYDITSRTAYISYSISPNISNIQLKLKIIQCTGYISVGIASKPNMQEKSIIDFDLTSIGYSNEGIKYKYCRSQDVDNKGFKTNDIVTINIEGNDIKFSVNDALRWNTSIDDRDLQYKFVVSIATPTDSVQIQGTFNIMSAKKRDENIVYEYNEAELHKEKEIIIVEAVEDFTLKDDDILDLGNIGKGKSSGNKDKNQSEINENDNDLLPLKPPPSNNKKKKKKKNSKRINNQ